MNILLVDDHVETCETLGRFLERLGHSVTVRHSGNDALSICQSQDFPMVISDIRMPGLSGIELLKAIKKLPFGKAADVVLMTGHGGVETAIQAMRAGAYDYLLKPVNIEELAVLTERIAEHQKLQRENQHLREHLHDEVREATADAQHEIVRLQKLTQHAAGIPEFGLFSQSMREIAKRCLQYHKDRSIPILIQGETGTGKELVARLIHYGNGTPKGSFVDVNCAALTASLFESELFGYEGGSFTGSLAKGRKGKLDAAAGGTLFLDEIGDMPIELQAKLLRVLQEREFYRVGGLEKIKADVRFVFATHVDLQERVKEGRFREDLFFRLRVGNLVLPPLRQRQEDILPLAHIFLEEAAKHKKKRFVRISKEAEGCLLHHHWPGNVRELRNVIEAAVVLFDDDVIHPEHLVLLDLKETSCGADRAAEVSQHDLKGRIESENLVQVGTARFEIPKEAFSLEELNLRVLQQTRQMFGGNLTQAAKHLCLSPRTLSYRLKEQGKKKK